VVLAAVFGVATVGAWKTGAGEHFLNEVWGIDVTWGVNGEKPGP
jgi:hypothetical protein